jgi:predicted enzyme related to lactoylglutathione lyase
MARINFIELPARNFAATKAFYTQAFGWPLADFGASYAATTSGDVDLGLQGDRGEASAGPLAVIAVENLDATLAAVQKAGGQIIKPIFSFPGGRRFHFRTRTAMNSPLPRRTDAASEERHGGAGATSSRTSA